MFGFIDQQLRIKLHVVQKEYCFAHLAVQNCPRGFWILKSNGFLIPHCPVWSEWQIIYCFDSTLTHSSLQRASYATFAWSRREYRSSDSSRRYFSNYVRFERYWALVLGLMVDSCSFRPIYEDELLNPVRNAIFGDIITLMLIQVQKMKVRLIWRDLFVGESPVSASYSCRVLDFRLRFRLTSKRQWFH